MIPSRRSVLLGGAALGVPAFAGFAFLKRSGDPRRVTAIVAGQESRDGAGVRLRRMLGGRELPLLDPFLLLDHFGSDDPADYLPGFPRHPHRGFETVTILLDGVVEHRDSVGNHGRLTPGAIQWMTAGRGIVHEEMPKPLGSGAHPLRMQGFQLWVNLPAAHKWDRPRYQDHAASDVAEVDLGDARARVLAGSVGRVHGPIDGVVVRPTVLDLTIPAGGELHVDLPGGDAAFAQVIDGPVQIGPDLRLVPTGALAVLSSGSSLQARGPGRVLLASAASIGEPVARRGPFVMNTEAELDQAVEDYRTGRLADRS